MADVEVPELERAKRLIRELSKRTAENGCSENEAMISATKVGALLQQFDLKLSEVLIGQEVCVQRELFAPDNFVGHMLRGIARLCSLRYYIKGGSKPPTYVIFGFERDIELAMYLYETLTDAMGKEWGDYSKINGFQRKKFEAFRAGFSERVGNRLIKMRAERDQAAAERARASDSKDLVLVRDGLVDEEFEKTGVRLVRVAGPQVRCGTSYGAGHEAGSRANIHTPVNGDTRSMLS